MAAHKTDKKPTGKKTQGIMFAVNSQNEISQVTKTQFLQFMFFFPLRSCLKLAVFVKATGT